MVIVVVLIVALICALVYVAIENKDLYVRLQKEATMAHKAREQVEEQKREIGRLQRIVSDKVDQQSNNIH